MTRLASIYGARQNNEMVYVNTLSFLVTAGVVSTTTDENMAVSYIQTTTTSGASRAWKRIGWWNFPALISRVQEDDFDLVHARDLIKLQHFDGAGTQVGAYFGFLDFEIAGNDRDKVHGIGFYYDETKSGWCTFAADGGTVENVASRRLYRMYDTGTNPYEYHHLMTRLEGRDRAIYWYIDGELVDWLKLDEGDWFGQFYGLGSYAYFITTVDQRERIMHFGLAEGYNFAIGEYDEGDVSGECPEQPISWLEYVSTTYATLRGSEIAPEGLTHLSSKWYLYDPLDLDNPIAETDWLCGDQRTRYSWENLSPGTEYASKVQYLGWTGSSCCAGPMSVEVPFTTLEGPGGTPYDDEDCPPPPTAYDSCE